MIRNSFVYYKDLKPFCNDLKTIYTAKNEKLGYEFKLFENLKLYVII